MLSLVNAHVNFLKSAQSAVVGPGTFAEQCGQHKGQLRKSLQAIPKNQVSLNDAADALDVVKGSCFSEQDKADIVASISAIVSNVGHSGDSPAASHRDALKQQEHLFMHRYMTEADWVALRNPSLSMASKIDVVIARSKAIGLLSLTEKTAKALSALVIVAHGQACDTNACYETTRTIKEGFRKMRNVRCASTTATCAKFPDVAATFVAAWPGAYEAGHGPIECPIDQSTINTLMNSMPCRCTHTSLRTQSFLTTSPSGRLPSSISSDVSALQNLLVPIAQALATQGQHGLKLEVGSPLGGVAITPPRQDPCIALPSTGPPHPSTPGGPLALQDGIASDSASPGKEELAEPASHEVGVGAKSMSDAIAEMQRTIVAKSKAAAAVPEPGEGEAAKGDVPAGKSKSAKGKCKGKGKSKGKGKAKASPKAKTSPNAKSATKVASTKSEPKPKMPPLKKVAPIRYKTCTIYCDVKKRKWRAVEHSEPRRDVKFSWKDGQSAWAKCLKWCDENSK